MKTLLKLMLFLMLPGWCAADTMSPLHGYDFYVVSQTWYVRPDGGTRYSSNITTGRCNGLADAPDPGSGTDQPCAFSDPDLLYQDGSFYNGSQAFPAWGWVIAGGDTVIIRGGASEATVYRFAGWALINNCEDGSGRFHGNCGDQSAPPPVPPSGTSGNPTRILGENYGACTARSARTKLIGGWGVGATMTLAGGAFIDVECLDMSDQSACGLGPDNVTQCKTGGVVQTDYANNGITLYSTSHDLTLTDIALHGFAGAGILGPTGGNVVVNDLQILGNANAGWNADPGDGTTGVGTLSVTNYNISWNGCVEEYPIVDAVPYFNCTDQSTGGYGDGFGTATVTSPPPGWQVSFDNGIVSYNTQDCLDNLHTSGNGSTVTITRTLAYGCEGQQIKAGSGAVATIYNNIINGNCEALTSGVPIPGRPVPTQDNLGSPCRAGNTAVLLFVNDGLTSTYSYNTLFSAGSVGVEVEYGGSVLGTAALKYQNNIFVGFYNSGTGENPPPLYSNGGPSGSGGPSALPALQAAGGAFTNNATFDQESSWSCPNTSLSETAAACGNPGLTDMTYHIIGYGNVSPATSAAVLAAGTPISGITADYLGNVRNDTTPTIGACELAGVACPSSSTTSPIRVEFHGNVTMRNNNAH